MLKGLEFKVIKIKYCPVKKKKDKILYLKYKVYPFKLKKLLLCFSFLFYFIFENNFLNLFKQESD
jgi:hypothetical protein